MLFVNCVIIFAIAFFLFCFGMMYYQVVQWKNYMRVEGLWKPWKEVRSELRLGRGVLFVDFGGPYVRSWWVPNPTTDDISIMEAETGFATYCPLWYRFQFVFRTAFPNSKLHQSFDKYFP